MNLRVKASIFFGTALSALVLLVVLYVQFIIGDVFRKQTLDDFNAIADQSESAYVAYMENMKTRTLDWASDSTLRNLSKEIMDVPKGSPEHARLQNEFAVYVTEKKMPFDKTIFLTDLLDKNGIVIASTNSERIGHDEGVQELTYQAHSFSKAINSKFGEAFTKSIVIEAYENPSPVVRATVRIAVPDAEGVFQPIDAVLLVHFANIQKISDILHGGSVLGQEASLTKGGFIKNHQTSDIYLVNARYLLATQTRVVKDVNIKQKIDTLPVRECFENGKEISGEYDDYNGVRVVGASMCFRDDGIVLIVEISKEEVFAPVVALTRWTIVGGVITLISWLSFVAFFLRRPIKNIEDIVAVTKRVTEGDFNVRAEVNTKDEIGYLASMFNKMVSSINMARQELELSKEQIAKKAEELKNDVASHEQQEKELKESKRATMNLLDDSWKAKEKLEEEKIKIQTILASIGDGLVFVDHEYKIVIVNAKLAEIFAIPEDELVGKDLRGIMKLFKKKILIEPEQWPTEEMFLTKKVITATLDDDFAIATTQRGSQLPIIFSIAPILGQLTGAVIVIRDVTADNELSEAKSGFISVASHQLRTPLTSIRWYSEMLLSEDAGSLTDTQKDFMKEIHSGAERLYQTVDLLLGISRVESGKLKAERKPIDLSIFTDDIKKELASQADEKGLEVSVTPPHRESVIVWLDPLTLRQVVLNLFSNAIRYTNDHGHIEVTWKMDESKKGNEEVVYSVHDDGIGIPVSVQSRIFSKFFRAENARAQVPDGSGLGLALVKELVESWGGRVWFETSEGKGTTFFFTVPLTSAIPE